MNKLVKIIALQGGLLSSMVACMEIRPISLPENHGGSSSGGDTTCHVESLGKNIVGTWHFESTYNPNLGSTTSGTITFDAKGQITDPDSLFENRLDTGPVIKKTYSPEVKSDFSFYSGMLFEVYQQTQKGKTTTYFTLVSNECNRVHLRLMQSGGNGIGFVLTR